ncbi:hypothetical protein LCGC14_2773610 [marine sediment metagenome]|uniref:FUZ/MON1/HPS1 first Longin domain-containing protein n=1 Tax=marine sediment metagenome TaxID=412755 RepID=A0A0F8YVD4_9ZZZZ
MVKLIQDLWILSQGGNVLYKRVFNVKMHAQLFGALLSALTSFSKEISNIGLTNFQSSSYKFTMLKKEPLDFVATSNVRDNVKKVKEGLNKISKIFFTKYKDILTDWDNWDRNTDSFSDFEGIIKAYLKVQ